MSQSNAPRAISLQRHWKRTVRTAILHVISLARSALLEARGRAAGRDSSELDRRDQEIAMLREELRIKDARLQRIAPHRRPHYLPIERLAILELRAARGWSLEQTARAFCVTAATLREWLRRLDEVGSHALAQLREPINKFPDFVGYLVQRLKTLCPTLGKQKIAETLARAGLHLASSTVGRMLRERPRPRPVADPSESQRRHRAKGPNDAWHVDFTTVPIASGFWTPWLPFTLPQRFPFCWWIAVVVDGWSRRVMGVGTFFQQPTSEQVRQFLGRTIHAAGGTPGHLVCDRGGQFDCHAFRRWCGRRGIKVRYGAVGRHGSIAVVERSIRTLKELLRQLALIPLRRERFRVELSLIVQWYNEHRPHAGLGGRTPQEVYERRFPANRRPRYEPREKWPRGLPCAWPWALVRGKPGAKLELEFAFLGGRKHLPVVTLKRAA